MVNQYHLFLTRNKFTNSNRNIKGNMLALVSAVVGIILLALCFFAFTYSKALGSYQEHRTAVEAASLAAAQDLARIVIDDPNYGYISLSDYPPIGRATLAGDGEPLPVLGINTVMATARLDTIIANEIGDETLKTLARQDTRNARAAAARLANMLRQAVQAPPSNQSAMAAALPNNSANYPRDLDGNPIHIYEHAREVYLSNLAKMSNGKPLITGFHLTLGWLADGSNTITAIPNPESKAMLPAGAEINKKYKAFISIPACNEEFTFAGLSQQSALVDSNRFKNYDPTKICSIIKVDAQHTLENDSQIMKSMACAQPGANEDLGPVGQLNISFPGGPVPGIESIRDLFTNEQLSTNTMDMYSPRNGDWPADVPSSHLVPTVIPSISTSPTVSEAFSTGFYHWLRTNRNKPDIQKVNELVDLRFTTLSPSTSPPTSFNFDFIPKAYARDPVSRSSISNYLTYVLAGKPKGLFDRRRDKVITNANEAVQAFLRLFQLRNLRTAMPPNTLAGVVSATGNVTSVDGSSITKQTLKDFWKDVANSSDAAHKTKDNALKAINDNLNPAIAALEAQGALSPSQQAELSSLRSRLALTQNALTNANAVIDQAGYIADDQLNLSIRGFTQADRYNWLLAQVLLRPHTVKANVEDFVQGRATPSGDRPSTTNWTEQPSGFYFYDYSQAMSNSPMVALDPPQHVNNITINNLGEVNIAVAQQSPWTQTPVSENQYLGIATKAMVTGDILPVTWVASMRDESAFLGRMRGGKHAGQPPAGSPRNFCQQSTYGGNSNTNRGLSMIMGQIASNGQVLSKQPRGTLICGGLAFEFQMRAPMVFNLGEQENTGEHLSEKVKTRNQTNTDLAPTAPDNVL